MSIPRAVWQDSDFLPPKTGLIYNLALSANTASAEVDTGITEATTLLGPQFVTLICDQSFYIVFGVTGMAAPAVATATCGGPFSAGVPYSFRIGKSERYFRAISTPASALRWWLSSGPGQ